MCGGWGGLCKRHHGDRHCDLCCPSGIDAAYALGCRSAGLYNTCKLFLQLLKAVCVCVCLCPYVCLSLSLSLCLSVSLGLCVLCVCLTAACLGIRCIRCCIHSFPGVNLVYHICVSHNLTILDALPQGTSSCFAKVGFDIPLQLQATSAVLTAEHQQLALSSPVVLVSLFCAQH